MLVRQPLVLVYRIRICPGRFSSGHNGFLIPEKYQSSKENSIFSRHKALSPDALPGWWSVKEGVFYEK